jgi:4-amino-4-deoxy-L-arabinose transferase-like glycosyltransferase
MEEKEMAGVAINNTSPLDEETSQREVTGPVPHKPPASVDRKGWLCCLLIALLFALWGLHAAGSNNIMDTDGARHAMNGAFIYDLLARGNWADLLHTSKILHYAKQYYSHLPALSLPYHPPLFPVFEAGFFFLFGVNVFAARLAIAVALALSAIGLFRLIIATHGSVVVAAFSTVTFLSLPYALRLGSDVMLEFPALVFVVLAMRCLADIDAEYPIGRALLFAVLAAAAVWTKQQTVFLGAVPFFYIALIGRWRIFRTSAIWLSSALFLVLVAALSALSQPLHGVGVNQVVISDGHGYGHSYVFMRNLVFYATHYLEPGVDGALDNIAGPIGGILLATFAAGLASRLVRRRPTALYISWAASSLLVLLILGPFSVRYLFFIVPPMFVLGYASLAGIGQRWPGLQRWVIGAGAVLVLGALAYGARSPVVYLRGPDEAAQVLASLAPHRILYCGGTDGNFIFSYRSHRQPLETIIIAGAKLPDGVFTTSALEEFARRYGVEYIVVERARGLRREAHPWEPLIDAPPPSAVVLRDIPLVSSSYRWNGLLRIYRFTNPSSTPDEELTMRMNMIGGGMRFALGQ